MFRKKLETATNSKVSFTAIVALIVAVIASIFFGLILNLHDWYAYTLRAVIFAPVGFWFAKCEDVDDGYFEEKQDTVNGKVLSNVIFTVVLFLLLLFIFGMVLAVPNPWIMTISCIVPFAIALFGFTKWKDEPKEGQKEDHSAECPYEVEPPDNDS